MPLSRRGETLPVAINAANMLMCDKEAIEM